MDESRVVGGYHLERRLGRGGMGEVWLGRHLESRGLAAVKLLRASPRCATSALFETERLAIGRLCHPNVVALYDVGPDYLVTTFIDGSDLARRARSPIDPKLALTWICMVGDALAHAHARGVIHRDVKPSNVLVDRREQAFLSDFGVALLVGEGDARAFTGTPGFMAPEQARGEPAGPAADQYALARTLLALLLGGAPPRLTAEGLALLPADFPARVPFVIARATEEDPARRFGSVEELVEELRRARSDTWPRATQRPPLRRKPERHAWAAQPQRTVRLADGLWRADHSLASLQQAGLVAEGTLAAVRDASGLADLGFSCFMSSARLGPLDEPGALARASELVVLLPGLFATRNVYDDLAAVLARDNAGSLVISVDILGHGTSPYAPEEPTPEHARPLSSLRAVRHALAALGLSELRTVLVGYSFSAAALLASDDADFGPEASRVALMPVMPALHEGVARRFRRTLRFMPLLPTWRWARRAILKRSACRLAREPLDEPGLHDLVESACAMTNARLSSLLEGSLATPLASALARCLVVTSPGDPVSPSQVVEPGLMARGVPLRHIFRLPSGGHLPLMIGAVHPEWRARNLSDLAQVIESALDLTRGASPLPETVNAA
jgi:hypothetical protein